MLFQMIKPQVCAVGQGQSRSGAARLTLSSVRTDWPDLLAGVHNNVGAPGPAFGGVALYTSHDAESVRAQTTIAAKWRLAAGVPFSDL